MFFLIKKKSFVNLSLVLDQVRLNKESADLKIWKSDRSGGFSRKSALVALQSDDDLQDFQFYKFVWKSGIPTRIKFFAWSLCLEKINTYDVFQRKRSFQYLSPSWCVMCKQDQESILHLFLQCEFTRMLWLKVFSEFGVVLDVPIYFLDLLKGCSNARCSNKIKEFWCAWFGLFCGIFGKKEIQEFLVMFTILHIICGIKLCIG